MSDTDSAVVPVADVDVPLEKEEVAVREDVVAAGDVVVDVQPTDTVVETKTETETPDDAPLETETEDVATTPTTTPVVDQVVEDTKEEVVADKGAKEEEAPVDVVVQVEVAMEEVVSPVVEIEQPVVEVKDTKKDEPVETPAEKETPKEEDIVEETAVDEKETPKEEEKEEPVVPVHRTVDKVEVINAPVPAIISHPVPVIEEEQVKEEPEAIETLEKIEEEDAEEPEPEVSAPVDEAAPEAEEEQPVQFEVPVVQEPEPVEMDLEVDAAVEGVEPAVKEEAEAPPVQPDIDQAAFLQAQEDLAAAQANYLKANESVLASANEYLDATMDEALREAARNVQMTTSKKWYNFWEKATRIPKDSKYEITATGQKKTFKDIASDNEQLLKEIVADGVAANWKHVSTKQGVKLEYAPARSDGAKFYKATTVIIAPPKVVLLALLRGPIIGNSDPDLLYFREHYNFVGGRTSLVHSIRQVSSYESVLPRDYSDLTSWSEDEETGDIYYTAQSVVAIGKKLQGVRGKVVRGATVIFGAYLKKAENGMSEVTIISKQKINGWVPQMVIDWNHPSVLIKQVKSLDKAAKDIMESGQENYEKLIKKFVYRELDVE